MSAKHKEAKEVAIVIMFIFFLLLFGLGVLVGKFLCKVGY